MRVFVLGGTGVVGRPLLPLLVRAGHDVVVAARTAQRARAVAAAGAQPARLASYEAAALTEAMRGCDAVVDLTTHVPPLSRAARRGAWAQHDWLRDEGTARTVAAAQAAGAARFVRDSVAFLHADGGQAWIDEDWPLAPGRHLASALAAERHAAGFRGDAVVLRLSLLYGPESSHTLAAVAMGRRLRVAPVLGDGGAYLSSLHTDDAAAAVAAALSVAPGGYDVGDDEPLRRRDLVGAQAAALGVRRLVRPPGWLPAGSTAEAQTRSHRISAARFRAAAGWAPVHRSAREGWQAVVAALA